VRAEIKDPSVQPFEYLFERESVAWKPEFAAAGGELRLPEGRPERVMEEARAGYGTIRTWKLVKGLVRIESTREKDAAALKLAAPESGSFVLVSLRRRRR